jgi:hypothetical protein
MKNIISKIIDFFKSSIFSTKKLILMVKRYIDHGKKNTKILYRMLPFPIRQVLRKIKVKVYRFISRCILNIQRQVFHPLYQRLGFWRTTSLCMLSGLIVVIGVGLLIHNINLHNSYKINPAVIKIVGNPDRKLLSGVSYDAKQLTYYLNKSSIGKIVKSNPNKIQLGSSGGTQPYSLVMPKDAHKGITFSDNTSGLSFSMAPQFSTNSGKIVDNHIVYPTGVSGAQDVYTIKGNGLQEDIAFNKAPKNTVKFDYKLVLPSDLQARLNKDGTLGVYSADPALFGNISYGSSKDQQKVAYARKKMTKNYLVFAIPAPQIKNIKGIVNGSKVVARYYLKGNILSVVASGLGDISGPFTIDPSVIIANASSFNNVNNEGGVSVDSTNSNIYEGGLTGGSVGTWTDNTGASGFTTARENFASVAYNGNLYVMGGGTQHGLRQQELAHILLKLGEPAVEAVMAEGLIRLEEEQEEDLQPELIL